MVTDVKIMEPAKGNWRMWKNTIERLSNGKPITTVTNLKEIKPQISKTQSKLANEKPT